MIIQTDTISPGHFNQPQIISKQLITSLVIIFILLAETAISFNAALLPMMQTDFAVDEHAVQLSIAIGLFALGFAGIIYGRLADALGRRPMFLISVTLYSLASFLGSISPSLNLFLIARFIQGMGAGAGWVVGNACLNDIYNGRDYIRTMNFVHATAGIMPAVAPAAGAYLGVLLGWRACYLLLGVLSFMLAIAMMRYHQETLPEKKAINYRYFFKDYLGLFQSKSFVVYLTVKVLAVMMIFVETANIPLIFVNYLDVPQRYFGLYLLPSFCVYILATIISSKYFDKFGVNKLIATGLSLLVINNGLMSVLSYLQLNHSIEMSAGLIQAIKIFSYFGWGLIFGNATAKIISALPEKSGMASAMMIALEMLCSSLGIYLLGYFFNGSMLPLSLFLFLFASITLFVFWCGQITK